MKGNKTTISASIFVLIILFGCGSTAQLYRSDDKNQIYTGKLSDTVYTSLKQFLQASTSSKIKDTIIIKYDYNNETCWDILDQSDDDYVRPFIPAHHEKVRNILAKRQNVSIFDFREPGQNLNKIKKWDSSIKIDTTKFLFKLLFKKRSTCGNSIIVMPDKNFVFLRSDAHSQAMDFTQAQIKELLKKQ